MTRIRDRPGRARLHGSGRSLRPRLPPGLAAWAGLFVAGCAIVGDGGAGRGAIWIYSSVPDSGSSDLVASKGWTPPGGTAQTLELRRTADGRRFYICRAFLDVCGSVQAVCKPHEFEAWFGENGEFSGYRVERAHPFTKAEHDPFLRRDYEQLDVILKNPTHELGELPAPRRATKKGEGAVAGVDGVTGATVAYYADRAVPKAFYTTHAIWYLVNVALPPVLQEWTLTWAGPDDVRGWIRRGEPQKAWWFLDRLEASRVPAAAAADLAYESLAATNRQVQAAALRYLRRTPPPFRPDACRSRDFASIPDETKSAFLDWWAEARHTSPALDAALRADLAARAAARSPVATAILGYLQRAGIPPASAGAWRGVLDAFARETPSTFLRTKAQALAGAIPAAAGP